MSEFHYRRITDPVHGTFGISRLESDIISTAVFQRLHNVRQLGLAYLVFPGAGYSRFAHSVGACHVAGRMMKALNLNGCSTWTSREIQKYRLAALLHDIGHYPFSHAMEHVILDHYKDKTFLMGAENAGDTAISDQPAAFDHEGLGRTIIEYDSEIGQVLKTHNFTRSEIRAVFSREETGGLSNLVSSDLDCDRLDYMMRTAHGAGLPYGAVDVEYITAQMCTDSDGRLCLTQKALRAADHFLISRYYDYTQVAYHKTAIGLEMVLRDCITALLARGLDYSGSSMKKMIENGNFATFDDQAIISKLRESLQETKDDSLKQKLRAVLFRKAPKLVAASERIAPRTETSTHLNHVDQLEKLIPELAETFSISEELWHLWKAQLNFSKIGSVVPLAEIDNEDVDDEARQVVRILTGKPGNNCTSKPLIEHDFALLKQLANIKLYAIRLYVHIPDDQPNLRQEIKEAVRSKLKFFPFSD